ncbi:CRISPR-associated endonuclease Cas2 [Thermobispora bispora]|uniref:CRISPR-associated endonuclease Cas2 n=1 Tax=Thermobispora bispora TaxID=2006 RepID=UPI00197E19CE|nr:CRISPR-associated endonuclease Cas2 [Thermobispora bispora]QSI46795.1 CRISPR-associated endonuclease Cas2 [Thermobispora bispora]
MFVILVYDTLAERNPGILKICRQYLHWVQRSVFQGELSEAQHRRLVAAIKDHVDPAYDSVLIYRIPGADLVQTELIGQPLGNSDSIL